MKHPSTFRQRLVMYALQCSYIIVLKSVRASIAMLAPIISTDLGLSNAQNALIISGFFQGYVVTMVPAAWLTQKVRVNERLVLEFCADFHPAIFIQQFPPL